VRVEGGHAVENVRVRDLKTGEERDVAAAGLFFAIGHKPNTDFLGGQLALDEQGYVITTPGTTMTSVPGVFAAGDVQDKKYRQAITAAGSGCAAALEAEHFLSAHPG
jgi:thioredoxin reductase (NADPH)